MPRNANAETATVVCGANVYTSTQLVGLTVDDVRWDYQDQLGIADNAVPFIEGEEVDSEYQICAGETVTFQKISGTKA